MNTIIQALKDHLKQRKNHFTSDRDIGNGCSTCGYGGDVVLELDEEALWNEIDKFCETFKKN